ncbi:MAG: DUF6172 family protein [Opitutales bacterium]
MKKTFPLQAPGKNDARVRDKIRHEVNLYVGRERRKELPEGCDGLEFNCKVGASQENAATRLLKEVGGAIDAVAQTGATQVYIEIISAPTTRKFPA